MIISVIGSGGKTTKIKQLKDRYLKEGKSVLMTTSTHMKIEENTLVDPSYEEIINEIKKHGYVHAGSKAKNQKIIYVTLLYKHFIVKKKMLNSPHKVLKI